MPLALYGSLADPAVRLHLNRAQSEPEKWSIYLVRENSNRRTAAQNRMFRAVIAKLAQQLGETAQHWHDVLVERFLGFDEIETEDGVVLTIRRSTADLTVGEFTEFLNACLRFAHDLQVH